MRSIAYSMIVAAGFGLGFGQAASAADLPVKARPAPIAPAPVWSWTGFYIGGHGGGAWGTTESSTDLPAFGNFFPGGTFALASATVNGPLAGGQAGFNFQSGPVVFGVEVDASWADIKGTTPCAILLTCERKTDWVGTATGRVGFTADKALIYVKGGGAWAHFKHDVSLDGLVLATAEDDKWGWTAGAGIEYAITPSWSAKLEYNYMDFGKHGTGFTPQVGNGDDFNIDVKQTIHAVKFGINYRLGSWMGTY